MQNDQKNLIIENNTTNSSDICERCKNAPVSLVCPECTPFHNYCKKCDSIVHELPSRINHQRSTVQNSNESENKQNYQTFIQKNDPHSQEELIITSPSRNTYQLESEINPNNFQIQKECLSNIPIINSTHEEILSNSMNINNIPIINNENILSYPKTPQRSHINVDILNNQSQNDEKINNNLEYIEIPQKNRDQEYSKTYTKEYVMELQNIHQKEKDELLFKISSLENTLERVKNTFNEQVKKMQANQKKLKDFQCFKKYINDMCYFSKLRKNNIKKPKKKKIFIERKEYELEDTENINYYLNKFNKENSKVGNEKEKEELNQSDEVFENFDLEINDDDEESFNHKKNIMSFKYNENNNKGDENGNIFIKTKSGMKDNSILLMK